MIKSKIFPPIRFLALFASCVSLATAAPYGPEGIDAEWTQPNGNQVRLKIFGDEFYGRTETLDGYTVVFDAAKNAYYYANRSFDGTRLFSTGVLAGAEPPAGLARNLDLSKARIAALRKAKRAATIGSREQEWKTRVTAVSKIRAAAEGGRKLRGTEAVQAAIQAAPFDGKVIGLTILAQFPRDANSGAINFPVGRDKIVRYCNGVGYTEDGNSGSVRDYFFDQSLGKLEYTQSVTQVITLPKARNAYNFADYPKNTRLNDAGFAGRMLLNDAINVLKAQKFDFTTLTTDTSGRALATNIFFAGSTSNVWSQGLWPHQWSLATAVSVGTVAKPVSISAYQITNIANAAPTIGTFCHENGHLILDYPDLYDYDGDSQGVGGHCLMGSGNHNNGGKTPAPLNIYFKDMVGWGAVQDLAAADSKTISLPTTGNVGYRIRKPSTPTEYFIVENRGEGDKWASSAVDKGIAIWHIDETVIGNNSQEMTAAEHYQVALVQADGRFDMELNRNRGDSGDMFDLFRPTFSDSTKPSARWWDGSASSIEVNVIGQLGAKTDVVFGGLPPNTIVVATPNGGEVIYPGSTFPITWKATITGLVKIELLKNGAFHSTIAATAPNSGTYQWAVDPTLVIGKDYSIQISSVTNIVPASDASDGLFSVTDVTFPLPSAMPYGWTKPRTAAGGWVLTKSTIFEGTHALMSSEIGDGQTAAVSYRSNFKAGVICFYAKVSSEKGYDMMRFYINGVRQPLPVTEFRGGISGETAWTFLRFLLPEGTHTLMWTYEKDTSLAGNKDRAWLDGVSLPSTTQEVAVASATNPSLIDGAETVTFPDTIVGATSSAQSFTISNTGKAALVGLRVRISGDFSTGSVLPTVLLPGTSASFSVAFKPTLGGQRNGRVRILSNDEDESEFSINLIGTGVGSTPPATASSLAASSAAWDATIASVFAPAVGSSASAAGNAVQTVEVVDGAKFLALTVSKASGLPIPVIEVSPDLLDWYSGSNHTTVIINDATLLKVRDNTPITPDQKRFIRAK